MMERRNDEKSVTGTRFDAKSRGNENGKMEDGKMMEGGSCVGVDFYLCSGVQIKTM
jgi:hypothetical protein